MLEPCRSRPRRGAAVVEFAVICPAVLLLIFGLFVGGMGIFRYQEVSHLAREGARYASTHGGKYQQDSTAGLLINPVPAVSNSPSDTALNSYLAGKTVLLDPNKLTVSVSWDLSGIYTPANFPSYADPNSFPPGQSIQNNVKVTVTYSWLPELYLVGPITLTCTSEMPMCY